MIESFLVHVLPYIFLAFSVYVGYVAISFVATLLSRLVQK